MSPLMYLRKSLLFANHSPVGANQPNEMHLNLLLIFVLHLFSQNVGGQGLSGESYEEGNPFGNGVLIMERVSSLPPSKKNYCNGTMYLNF